jgi:ribonucleoside-diphosphate reductase alpha chain
MNLPVSNGVSNGNGTYTNGHTTNGEVKQTLFASAAAESSATVETSGGMLMQVQAELPLTGKQKADLCPECGSHTLVFEEGCAKCYTCGHSEC